MTAAQEIARIMGERLRVVVSVAFGLNEKRDGPWAEHEWLIRDLLAFFSDMELEHLEDLINKERVRRKMDAELDEFEMREHEHALRNSDGRMI